MAEPATHKRMHSSDHRHGWKRMRTIADRGRPPEHGQYLLANSGKETARRFAALSALFDEGTILRLNRCGVGPGWQCLEVGAGGGSMPLG